MNSESKVWNSDPPRQSSLVHWIVAGVLFIIIAGITAGAGYWLVQIRKGQPAENPHRVAEPVPELEKVSLEQRLEKIEREQKLAGMTAMRRYLAEQPEIVNQDFLEYYDRLLKNVNPNVVSHYFFLTQRFPFTEKLALKFMNDSAAFSEADRKTTLHKFGVEGLNLISKLCVENNLPPSKLPREWIELRFEEKFYIDPALTARRQKAQIDAMNATMNAEAERSRHRIK